MTELSRSILERETEINSIQRELSHQLQRRGDEAYTLLLVKVREREKDLQVAVRKKHFLGEMVIALRKQIKVLQETEKRSASDVAKVIAKMGEERKSMAEKIAGLQMETEALSAVILTADEITKKSSELIEQFKQEKEEITKKAKQSEDAREKLEEFLAEKEKRIGVIMEENEGLFKGAKEATKTIESQDILLSEQQRRIEEQSNLIKTYEKRFLAKGMDFHKSTSFVVHYLIYFFLQR